MSRWLSQYLCKGPLYCNIPCGMRWQLRGNFPQVPWFAVGPLPRRCASHEIPYCDSPSHRSILWSHQASVFQSLSLQWCSVFQSWRVDHSLSLFRLQPEVFIWFYITFQPKLQGNILYFFIWIPGCCFMIPVLYSLIDKASASELIQHLQLCKHSLGPDSCI